MDSEVSTNAQGQILLYFLTVSAVGITILDSDRKCDGALTREMDKFKPAVTKSPLSAQDKNVSLATNYDLARLEVRDLRSMTGQERLEAYAATKMQFVDEGGPTSPLPMFVTRTTLVALLADERSDDADSGAYEGR